MHTACPAGSVMKTGDVHGDGVDHVCRGGGVGVATAARGGRAAVLITATTVEIVV
jgi:hypothetical protein